MRHVIVAGMAGILSFGSVPVYAQSAMLTDLKGSVVLNRGEGFVPVSSPSQLSVGDRVVVGDGAKARLVYGDGCTVQLKPRSVTTVSVASPCTVVTPAADMPDVIDERVFPWPLLLAAAAGAAIIVIADDDDDDDDDDEEHED